MNNYGVEMSNTIIVAESIRKRFGKVLAVDGVSFEVKRGEIFGFLGPNGAGKTTTMRVLLGIIRPESGRSRLFGMPSSNPKSRVSTGYAPEAAKLHEYLTAEEMLQFYMRLQRIPKAHWNTETSRVLDVFGLTDAGKRRIKGFSGGMSQRLRLAQALLGDPELVFFDEPTSNLDPLGRMAVRGVIENLKSSGKTIFLNSHLLTEVERICDRVMIIKEGQIVAMGTVNDLLASSDRVIAEVPDFTVHHLQSFREKGFDLEIRENFLEFRNCGKERIPEIVNILVGKGLRVFAVYPVRRTLEDVFMQVVNDGDVARFN